MNFIAILTVFLMLWRWQSFSIIQEDAWFVGMVQRDAPVTGGYWLYCVSVLLPVVFVLACVIAFHDQFYGLIHYLMAVFILAYSLGRLPLHDVIQRCRTAWRNGDNVEWNNAVSVLQPSTIEKSRFGQLVSLREAYIYAAFQGMLAVLFWFVVLGPAGAVLYRLTEIYTRQNSWPGARKILEYMEWPAAVLASLTFVLVGNFDKGMACWLSTVMNRGMSVKNMVHANALAAQGMDMGWLLMEDADNTDETIKIKGSVELESLMLLVRRSVIFTVFTIAIFQIVI